MDFIERIFHISPDGGSGVLEFAITFAVLLIPLLVALMIRRKHGID
jgi:hypothetical protein